MTTTKKKTEEALRYMWGETTIYLKIAPQVFRSIVWEKIRTIKYCVLISFFDKNKKVKHGEMSDRERR